MNMSGSVKNFLVLALVVVLVFASYLYFKRQGGSVPITTSALPANAPHNTDQITATSSSLQLFAHPSLHFSFFVPVGTAVAVRPEAGGAETDVFTSAKDEKEFQLFILPYHEGAISSSRIEEDTHGTATGTPQEIVIGSGLHALAFTSADPRFGRMREVWFLFNGHLIEATTYIQDDEWLSKILNSFKAD